ncbi:alpha/beta hydrolase fold [Gracilibacillus ureilyticus]|uniref:Alpha/beta hydrolase fold n=1 Tax=Gracilibacillus ureilyticus TaxID=531814 RepID=A0A1H9LHL1_9BACI|nr:alpha/beta hydrolase [Gracilibacillus ureilyticus]SER10868.1 alpha/beta hydrolase fold [Gracilibacillus ureilyticus]
MKILKQSEIDWQNDSLHEKCPSLTPFLLENKKNAPFIIVIPGGGYSHRAFHEGEPVAKWLNENGFHAAVLRYQVAPIYEQEVISNGQMAVRAVRFHADNWGISPEKIGVLGFSAGGHLAAIISNLFDDGDKSSENTIMNYSSRPDFHILCYPVITMGEHTHQGSKNNLIGEQADEKLVARFSADKLVTENTPPAFIWSTANDPSVSNFNSLHYAEALQHKNIPYDLHIYQEGRHGLGLADEHPHVYMWQSVCLNWLNQYISKK